MRGGSGFDSRLEMGSLPCNGVRILTRHIASNEKGTASAVPFLLRGRAATHRLSSAGVEPTQEPCCHTGPVVSVPTSSWTPASRTATELAAPGRTKRGEAGNLPGLQTHRRRPMSQAVGEAEIGRFEVVGAGRQAAKPLG